ncbi:MAG: type II toxin-antitoxin system RelE/ParE family toxin [Candidatus Binatia bacterium]
MPRTEVVFFRENDGSVPLIDWLAALPSVARAKCRVRLDRLEKLGHELRRPEADCLRDGIYELRTKHAGLNYRMLYFFHGRRAAIVSHGIIKQQAEVPPKDIQRAAHRKKLFEADPQRHTFVPAED